jgi:hypothetical protein
MAWLSRVNFISSDTLSFTDINNLGNDIRAWGGNVNGGGYTLSNVVLSASAGTMATVIGGTGTTSTLTLRSTSGVGTTGADIIFQAGNNGASEIMRLLNGGNVGIGTASPDWQTTVYGTGQNTALLTDAGSKSASLFVGSSNGTAGAGGAVLLGGITVNGVTSQWAIKSIMTLVAANGTADLAFSTRAGTGDTSLTERMRLFSSGQVSIGDTTVGTTLRVRTSTNNGFSVTDGTVTGILYASSGPAVSIGSLTAGAALVVYSGNANVWTFHTNGSITSSTGASLTAGGVWTNASDVALKRDFSDVNAAEILESIAKIPIKAWEYIAEPGVKHIGPTAQDFLKAFGFGGSDKCIGTVDAIGVLMSCIQELKAKIDILEARN